MDDKPMRGMRFAFAVRIVRPHLSKKKGKAMKQYKKKPVVIEAIQWTGDNAEEIIAYGNNSITRSVFDEESLWIGTLEGVMVASKGDFIIKGVRGEFYPCKPDIFWQTYEEVGE